MRFLLESMVVAVVMTASAFSRILFDVESQRRGGTVHLVIFFCGSVFDLNSNILDLVGFGFAYSLLFGYGKVST